MWDKKFLKLYLIKFFCAQKKKYATLQSFSISLCIDSIFAQLSENLIKGQENDFFYLLGQKISSSTKSPFDYLAMIWTC